MMRFSCLVIWGLVRRKSLVAAVVAEGVLLRGSAALVVRVILLLWKVRKHGVEIEKG